ncbi:BQ5605_C015g07757 [Microbotryum silenes-dioicae]|uniref:BQ5605_C015g07757 protein n=1 Tax=Microbotryum silenes-dioicae TaxID=796604 RepID=A0A2X0LXG1_9BASI|nr:BQ5605_C015g07757 [Microbotryum silenes-dioicae]
MYCPCQSRNSLTVFAFYSAKGAPTLCNTPRRSAHRSDNDKITGPKYVGLTLDTLQTKSAQAHGPYTLRSWTRVDPWAMIVKQSRIQKMLRWLINESKNSAHSAVSFDGDLYDSDFDATQVFRQLAFRVPKEKVARIAAALLEIDMDVVSEMIKKSKDTNRYKAATEAEKHINRILAELQSAGDKIHGTTAQMLGMRNEIRGYVNAFGILGRIKDKFLDQADTV